MSKNWRMLTGLLFLGSVGTLQAHPLDLPDIVYIDGLPCNSACQSYMAWSRQKRSPTAEQPAPEKPVRRSSYGAVHRATTMHRESPKPAAHARIAKQAVPMPPAKIAGPQPAGNAAAASEAAPANVAASRSSGGEAAISAARTVQEQVAAPTTLAEHATIASAAPVPQPEANNAEAAQPSDTGQTASAPTSNTDNLVAVLMARPEIKSISDLTGKDVAIEGPQSASGATIRTAIAAAGAAEVQLNEGHTKAIDRLI